MARLKVIILGCTGGPIESNLSSYLLLDSEKNEGILLDAGTIFHGLIAAQKKAPFTPLPLDQFFKNNIKAYLISHVHLDHILGLTVASQVDRSKSILAFQPTIDDLKEHIFNGKIWIHHEKGPHYSFIKLEEGKCVNIPETEMKVTPFLLNHSEKIVSGAFLIQCKDDFVLYFGDTSSDSVEKVKRNNVIWQKVAPLVEQKKLKAIFLECSYPDILDHALFGHLNPTLFMRELDSLASLVDGSLEGLKVIVTHRKENFSQDPKINHQIEEQLKQSNKLKVDLIFPTQGDQITLS